MLSHVGDSDPSLRTAHFLKPIANSIDEPSSNISSSFVSEPNEWPLNIHFNGWRQQNSKWDKWVDELKLKHETVWKKVGIFEAIMSTKCRRIRKNQNLLYGIVEKWCCETNTFVFPFGEATITLEDIMVLGGYPVIGDPVFASLEDQEMKEIEEKLILAREQLYRKQGGRPRTTLWMDVFVDKGREIEHEAFLATWLSVYVFPHKALVKKSLFPIAVHLASGNPIALAPAILASIYKDLTLFKKTIVGLSKYPVGGDRFSKEVSLQSPFYLVQIWVWGRFKSLQSQLKTTMTNHGDPFWFRWRRSKDMKIEDVRLALDSGIDDFIWRPYVRYADKRGMFYPNDEILVPFKKDLVDEQMLSFVICLRVSELVGFDSIEQYLPHRVAMQFGMDQDVPSDVPRFNEAKSIAWKHYCRLISDKKLYFPSRFFEGNVTSRYARWWKQLVFGSSDFVKKSAQQKRCACSAKPRANVGKANKSGNDVGVPPGFPPNLVDTLRYKCGGIIHESKHLNNQCSSSLAGYEKILPLKRSISKDNIELSIRGLEEDFEDANASKEARCKNFSIRKKVTPHNNVTAARQDLQFHSDMAAQADAKETAEEKEREARDDEVMVLLKEESLKNQEELARLARQQEEMLRLMGLWEKKDEELRQLLTSVLRNQQPSSFLP